MTNLNDGFFVDDGSNDADELIAFWEKLGRPEIPAELADIPIETLAEQAVSGVREQLGQIRQLIIRTQFLISAINLSNEREPEPNSPTDKVTADVCKNAVKNSDIFDTVVALARRINDLNNRAKDPELNVLKLGKIVHELVEAHPLIERVVNWHVDLRRNLNRDTAQLN